MKKLIIKKQGLEVQHCKFDDEQVMQDFIKLLADQAPWGKPDRWLPYSPMSPLSDEEKAKAKESRKVIVKEAKPESIVQVQKELEDGSIVTEDVVIPAVEEESYMEYFFPAEYTIEIEDITAQVETEKAQIEAIKNAQLQAGLRLQAFPAQIDSCQDLSELKLAIKQMVQDIAVLLR